MNGERSAPWKNVTSSPKRLFQYFTLTERQYSQGCVKYMARVYGDYLYAPSSMNYHPALPVPTPPC